MTEADLQRQVLALCRWLGLLAYHTRDSRRSAKGFPDIVCVGPGGHLFAELKSEDGVTTAEQDDWLWMLRRGGAAAFVWRPGHWQDGTIEHALKELA